ncbi:MAG: hypothetical protein ACXWUG_17990 [Polyangiales bacterium]
MRALVAASLLAESLLAGCSSDVVVGVRTLATEAGTDDAPTSAHVDWSLNLTTASLPSTDIFSAIALAPDGDVVAAGSSVTSKGATHTDVWIVRISATGEKKFSKSHDEEGLNDSASGVVVDPDGFPITVGTIKTAANQEDVWVRRWTPDLGISWTATHDDEFHQADFGGGIALDSDRNVIAVGSISRPGEGRNVLVWKLDPTGKTLWTREIIGDAHLDDDAYGVAVDPVDQSIEVVGVETTTEPRGTIWKLDAKGERTATIPLATRALRSIAASGRTFYVCGQLFVARDGGASRTLADYDARGCATMTDGLALVGASSLRVLGFDLADRLDFPLPTTPNAVTSSASSVFVAGTTGYVARITLR